MGDDFQLYRALRSTSPTPFQYYLDFGTFRVIGCSPEAQLVVSQNKAEIHPIAGTFQRTGKNDLELAQKLINDKKESAEHSMLVDLARNDLSIFCDTVCVEKFKEAQFFSHVIHLTSLVTGTIRESQNGIDVFFATFPAGTLSGAPKYRAMEIIDGLEPTKRETYGGAIGFFGFNDDVIHAIAIRSILSSHDKLSYQGEVGLFFFLKMKKNVKKLIINFVQFVFIRPC